MMKIVATNVVASQLPEWQPSATPTLVPIFVKSFASVGRPRRSEPKPFILFYSASTLGIR